MAWMPFTLRRRPRLSLKLKARLDTLKSFARRRSDHSSVAPFGHGLRGAYAADIEVSLASQVRKRHIAARPTPIQSRLRIFLGTLSSGFSNVQVQLGCKRGYSSQRTDQINGGALTSVILNGAAMFSIDAPDSAFGPDLIAKGQRNALGTALMDLIECGLVVCDSRGCLLLANRAARREFSYGKAIKLVDGLVRPTNDTQPNLHEALRDAVHKQKTRLLVLGDAGHRLVVVTMPLPFEQPEAPAALVMLGQRSLCSPLAIEMLALRHGLTRTERRIFGGLLANRSPREIAALHCVSLPTVRTQIQSIRDKIGVRSIDELLLFAAQVPPISARYEAVIA